MQDDCGSGLRIALDLQACQTLSRDRGIGRYAASLSRALLAQASPQRNRFVLGCDATYVPERAALMRDFEHVAEPAQWTAYDYAAFNRPIGDLRDTLRPAAGALVRDHYRRLAPSIVHVNSLFEGFVEGAAPLDDVASMPGALSSVTLYDLIPLVFEQHYLVDPVYRRWYESKLDALRRFDILLSISAASSRDAERLLGIPADRIHVIGGGVSDAFRPRRWSDDERAALNTRFGIDGRFVLYTGNSDPRKNLHGAVRAFADIPRERRDGVQLVLNQVGDEAALRAIAKQAGLAPRDLVVTGHVDDDALIGLLQTCEVFYFPSLYEGFGLPVLEAMACGVPVLAGDNSSIPEVLPARDALFDAGSDQAGAASLARVLGDADMRRAMAERNVSLAREHTWDRVARRAVDAWESHAYRRTTTPPAAPMRIAMVTPLPPDRSGIADYAVDLAAGMAPHCTLAFFTSPEAAEAAPQVPGEVHPWQSLPALADRFDHVVYHFGNSPFHSHMVELLDQVPGSVVLHDLFLSSMLWHMDRHAGRAGLFERELERSHGRVAVKCVEDEGDLAARRAYPASRRILERATHVVVHSRHAIDLAGRYFPQLKRAPMTYVPMPIPACAVDATARAAARQRLGIEDDAFVVASFGFIADTKLSHRLVEAAAGLGDTKVRIVLVGENDGGDYGRDLAEAVRAVGKRVRITGFVDAAAFSDWLDAADAAVQLRAMSRGESSKTVLDCLARGLPTIVNDFGAFAELPSDVVVRLPADPSADAIRAAIETMATDANATTLGARGRAYVESEHAPQRVGFEMVDAFRRAREVREDVCEDALVDALADALGAPAPVLAEVDAVHAAIARAAVPWREPRLYVDMTEVVRVDHGTGIHRVVRNVARELMLHPDATTFRTLPVAHMHSNAERVERFVQEKLGVPETRLPAEVAYAPGDVLLLLDSAWESCERFDESIARVRAAGGRVGAMVYDLIPLRYSQYCVEFMPAVFRHWLEYVVRECDFIVCISRAVADDLKAWIDEGDRPHARGLRIGHVHLGADVEEGADPAPASNDVVDAMRGGQAWLMVGTVEPRKRYDVALDAFDALWAQGSDLKLVIAGKPGWNVEPLIARIKAHPQLGKRLAWFPKISDGDLAHAYANARGLLQTSDAEGFGLPIVEAARFERPLVLSDIAVFREIAGQQARYFAPGDARGLADLLARGDGVPARNLAITWRECARRLLGLLRHGRWDHAYGD